MPERIDVEKNVNEAIERMQVEFEIIRSKIDGLVGGEYRKRRRHEPTDNPGDYERVFQYIWAGLYTFDPAKAKPGIGWIWRVAQTAVTSSDKDSVRPASIHEFVDDLADDKDADPDYKGSKAYQAYLKAMDAMCRALECVRSRKRREILLLTSYFPDIDYDRVCRIMRLPSRNAAKELKYHALREMRQNLGSMGFDRSVTSLIVQ